VAAIVLAVGAVIALAIPALSRSSTAPAPAAFPA
jgi:hypothetical protein